MRLDLHHAHAWNLPPRQAVNLQRELAGAVRIEPLERPPRSIAGVDMSVRVDRAQATVAVHAWPGLAPLAQGCWRGAVEYPYVPGLLSFRETPAILRALEQLETLPDLILADGQGLAHPRRFGVACHLGVLLDRPVVGVAKSRLLGEHAALGEEAGSVTPLLDGDEVIGMVVRTRSRVRPLYVSVGHRITLEEAVRWVLASTTRYRLPQPARQAHLLSRTILD